MAKSKSSVEIRQQSEQMRKQKQFDQTCRKLNPWGWLALGLIGVALLFCFFDWTDIYNTDIVGTEVEVNGWSYAIAGLTHNYSSTASVYGDMAVPFYYYATSWVETLGLLTVLAVALALVSAAVQIVGGVRKTLMLNVVTAVLNLAAAVLLTACFATALSMSGSDILPVYCSGNPACSIRSFAILPALAAYGAAAVSGITAAMYLKAKKLLK